MEYGKITGIDKPVSKVVQGTMMLSKDREDWSRKLLDAVFETGINTFDAAHVYGGGDCDRVFGAWARDRGIRDQIVLMDKGAHHSKDRKRVTPYDITADLHDCLARLGFDSIDLFVMHRDDPDVPVGPIVEELNRHLSDGLIGGYGGSNWSHLRIQEANQYAEDHDLVGFAVSSPHFSLATQVDDPWGNSITITGKTGSEARAWYAKNQMPVMCWSSLCGGFFSERFTRENLDSFTENADTRCVRCYCVEENFQRLDRAKSLARDMGVTVPQIALGWVLQGQLNCFPLMAAWEPEQATDNAKAADLRLTERQVAWLNLEVDTL